MLWAAKQVSWGGHQTIRGTPRREVPDITCQQVLEQFRELGPVGEELEEYEPVAFDVPPGVALQPVRDLLVRRDASSSSGTRRGIAAAWPAD